MGMLKEGVRLDRVRGGRQKYRRTSEAPYQGQNYSLKKSNIDGILLIFSHLMIDGDFNYLFFCR